MTLEEKVGQMTQIYFPLIAASEEQNSGDPIDQDKLEDAVGAGSTCTLNTPACEATCQSTSNRPGKAQGSMRFIARVPFD